MEPLYFFNREKYLVYSEEAKPDKVLHGAAATHKNALSVRVRIADSLFLCRVQIPDAVPLYFKKGETA